MDTEIEQFESELVDSVRKYARYALAFFELQNIILEMMTKGKKSIDLDELDQLIVKLKTESNGSH